MNEEKYIALIAQHLSGEISESNRNMLMEWVESDANNKALLDETSKLWEISEGFDTPFEANINEAWNKVERKLDREIVTKDSSAKVVPISNFKRFIQIAAVFLIGIATWYLVFQKNIEPEIFTYQTTEEELLELQLPDKSRVILNENSQLTFVNKEGKRMVTLEGEAWFDVEYLNDIPFEIMSGDAQTRVLGTAFNVRAYPAENKIEVSVERGKVAFSQKDDLKNTKELPAGTEAVFYKKEKKIIKEKRETDNVDAWRTMTMKFDHVKMYEVFETLERYYEIKIEGNPNLTNCSLRGTYKDPKLEDMLQIISIALDAEYKKEGNIISFSGGGCPPVN